MPEVEEARCCEEDEWEKNESLQGSGEEEGGVQSVRWSGEGEGEIEKKKKKNLSQPALSP